MEEIKKSIKKYSIIGGVFPQTSKWVTGDFKLPKSPFGTDYKIDTENYEIVLIYFENDVEKVLRKRYRPEK